MDAPAPGGNPVEHEHEGIRVTWDPRDRLVRFRYPRETALTASAAEALIPVVREWTRDGAPYGILVDASTTTTDHTQWRKRWAEHHRLEKGRLRIAITHASPFIQGFLYLYSGLTGIPLRCFPTERHALAWLCEGRAGAA